VLKPQAPNSDEDRDEKSDELAPADSLDRLSDFAKRIVAVPKSEIDDAEKKKQSR